MTVNDRASDRDVAPKASLTVASTVLLQIFLVKRAANDLNRAKREGNNFF